MKDKKKYITNLTLFSLILFISLGLFCASTNGWLPLVHGPYYYSIAKSIFHYNEINYYAIYPPVNSLVYTLQIGISFFEYFIFFISEKYWFLFFYIFTSAAWIIVFREFLTFSSPDLNKSDKYFLFFIFFFQPYNLNQLANFSNEALYIPLLIYFYFSFFKITSLKKINNFYLFCFSIFIIFGIFFRLHHIVLCINFFIFSLFIKNKKIILGLIFIGIVNILIFGIIIKYTYLQDVFLEHLDYVNNNLPERENFFSYSNLLNILNKFFIIITYPILLTKFTNNLIIYYFSGIFFLSLIISGFILTNKNNKLFNLYNINYLILSTIFVISLPPFEYSYILPFSFIIYFYIFLTFKNIFKKNYEKIFKIVVLASLVILVLNYFFIGKRFIEGFEYRKFIKDLKNNYIYEDQPNTVFYAAEDLYDHLEDFYWQQKTKKPYCQLKITIKECGKIQETRVNQYALVIGKNADKLFRNMNLNEKLTESDIAKIAMKIENNFNEQNYDFEFIKYYKSDFYYYFFYINRTSWPSSFLNTE